MVGVRHGRPHMAIGPDDRRAITLRGVQRAYGIARDRVSAAIRAGELPASRIGARRLTILVRDVEGWIARHRISPSAEQRVEQIRARERRR